MRPTAPIVLADLRKRRNELDRLADHAEARGDEVALAEINEEMEAHCRVIERLI